MKNTPSSSPKLSGGLGSYVALHKLSAIKNALCAILFSVSPFSMYAQNTTSQTEQQTHTITSLRGNDPFNRDLDSIQSDPSLDFFYDSLWDYTPDALLSSIQDEIIKVAKGEYADQRAMMIHLYKKAFGIELELPLGWTYTLESVTQLARISRDNQYQKNGETILYKSEGKQIFPYVGKKAFINGVPVFMVNETNDIFAYSEGLCTGTKQYIYVNKGAIINHLNKFSKELVYFNIVQLDHVDEFIRSYTKNILIQELGHFYGLETKYELSELGSDQLSNKAVGQGQFFLRMLKGLALFDDTLNIVTKSPEYYVMYEKYADAILKEYEGSYSNLWQEKLPSAIQNDPELLDRALNRFQQDQFLTYRSMNRQYYTSLAQKVVNGNSYITSTSLFGDWTLIASSYDVVQENGLYYDYEGKKLYFSLDVLHKLFDTHVMSGYVFDDLGTAVVDFPTFIARKFAQAHYETIHQPSLVNKFYYGAKYNKFAAFIDLFDCYYTARKQSNDATSKPSIQKNEVAIHDETTRFFLALEQHCKNIGVDITTFSNVPELTRQYPMLVVNLAKAYGLE